MRLNGRIWKDGKWWLVEVPLLDALTQGRTRREAYAMIEDWIETMANREGFKAVVHPGKGETFEVSASDAAILVAMVLRRQREKSGLSLADVAKRLGARSRNEFARYEQGKSVPTVSKLAELVAALGHDVVLSESRSTT